MAQTLDLDQIARQLKAAQDERRQLAPITASLSDFGLEAGYAVADRIHRARLQEGAVAVGRKIGFTNAAIWPAAGLTAPAWAYLYAATTTAVPDDRARCDISGLVQPKIEPEIVVRLRSAPPAGADHAAILASIDWIAHGFEIVQGRFIGKATPADALADGLVHGALVIGEPQPVARLGKDPAQTLAAFSVRLYCNGQLRETGSGANVLGNPLAAIAQLIAVLARQRDYPPLQAGEIVTTGTLTAAHPIAAGEVWHTELEGIDLPGLTVEFVA
jgi:2-keto-4-pentenoate hydratase